MIDDIGSDSEEFKQIAAELEKKKDQLEGDKKKEIER